MSSTPERTQAWSEFFRQVFRSGDALVGFAACALGGVGVGLLVIATDAHPEILYAIGATAAVALGSGLVILRLYELHLRLELRKADQDLVRFGSDLSSAQSPEEKVATSLFGEEIEALLAESEDLRRRSRSRYRWEITRALLLHRAAMRELSRAAQHGQEDDDFEGK